MKTILWLAATIILSGCSFISRPFQGNVYFEHPQTQEVVKCQYPYWVGIYGGLAGANLEMDNCIWGYVRQGYVERRIR